MFGALIDSGEPVRILWGYLFGGGLLLVAGVATSHGVAAERRPLEEVARPLSVTLDDAP